ncbi:MAG: amidohydrolase family protein [Lachnospiraceae bacterium]|nr:amidohydrolase family protein [Lachnospiraceae bacterium]
MDIYHGSIVYSKSKDELAQFTDSYIAVENGVVEGIYPVLPEKFAGAEVTDFGNGVIIPAFSDLHVHAPQYPQRGIAMDALLYDWLHGYTFPLESKYADPEFAKTVYDAFVDDMIAHGTMHAVVFGTIHSEATGYLIERMENAGLHAYVGKVNMDMESPDYLCETAEDSLRLTEEFLERYMGNRTAKPILTPRFAPTCTFELMKGLGKLGQKYQVGVQTHLVESRWEAEESVRLYPECGCDTGIYEHAGLLGNGPVVGAHFIFPKEDDIRILKKYGGYAVQCPDSTLNIIAGIMQTGTLMDRGVNLGFGSDIAGGANLGVYSQVSRSVQLSKLKEFYEPDGNRTISFAEAFWIGTKHSGELFGKVGSLERGYQFDTLVIDGLADPFHELTPAELVERFCYLGETGHIRARYLAGREI